MATEIRKEIVIAAVTLVVAAAIVVGVRFLNSATAPGAADVPETLDRMQAQTPQGLPVLTAEEAHGDAVSMGRK